MIQISNNNSTCFNPLSTRQKCSVTAIIVIVYEILYLFLFTINQTIKITEMGRVKV